MPSPAAQPGPVEVFYSYVPDLESDVAMLDEVEGELDNELKD